MSNKSQRIRAKISRNTFGTIMDMGHILRYSRKAMGMSIPDIAQYMNVSATQWSNYERNKSLIPSCVVMKLVMFGMDFWCKNYKPSEHCTLNTAH